MRVNIYKTDNTYITTLNVKNMFDDNFYHCNMPTIGAATCKRILGGLYPNIKADGVTLIFENLKTSEKKAQKLFRNGTILDF